MKPAKFRLQLLICRLLLFMIIVSKHSSARTLGNSTPAHHDHRYQKITFLMQNVLINVSPPSSSQPATTTTQTQVTSVIPFSKPLGFFPPGGGIPLQESIPTTGASTQSLDFFDIGLSFPARATLQELEFGSVKEIDEALFESTSFGPLVVGKAHGIFVASSEYGTSRMIAMTATFSGNGFKDGLKFFGVHKTDLAESHVAVIGGTGKYSDANGYAVIKTVAMSSEAAEKADRNILNFTVFLS